MESSPPRIGRWAISSARVRWLLVLHYAEAGDLDAAFEHLHRLIDAHDPALVTLAVAPQWDSLRADPRFNECLARMKLQPAGNIDPR